MMSNLVLSRTAVRAGARGLVAAMAYGVAVWLAFELGLAPLLGLQHARTQRPVSRAVLALDHILYGLIVADRLAPEPGPPGQKH
jgi:hypothetical protein